MAGAFACGTSESNLGDKSRASEYTTRAQDSLSKLEERWGSDYYKTYLRRPDIFRFRKQLYELRLSLGAGVPEG
ncbi:MAG: hypothetical protein ABJC10_11375 [Acidobacteriota bacterium]